MMSESDQSGPRNCTQSNQMPVAGLSGSHDFEAVAFLVMIQGRGTRSDCRRAPPHPGPARTRTAGRGEVPIPTLASPPGVGFAPAARSPRPSSHSDGHARQVAFTSVEEVTYFSFAVDSVEVDCEEGKHTTRVVLSLRVAFSNAHDAPLRSCQSGGPALTIPNMVTPVANVQSILDGR